MSYKRTILIQKQHHYGQTKLQHGTNDQSHVTIKALRIWNKKCMSFGCQLILNSVNQCYSSLERFCAYY